jgi:hypothetical protein
MLAFRKGARTSLENHRGMSLLYYGHRNKRLQNISDLILRRKKKKCISDGPMLKG